MDRGQAKEVSAEMMKALAKIEKKLGVTFSRGNGSFDANTFSLKITATSNASDGSIQTKEEVDFLANAFMFGLKKEDLGKTFNTSNGRTFRICGLKPRANKYPVLAKSAMDGKVYKFSPYQTGLAHQI